MPISMNVLDTFTLTPYAYALCTQHISRCTMRPLHLAHSTLHTLRTGSNLGAFSLSTSSELGTQ